MKFLCCSIKYENEWQTRGNRTTAITNEINNYNIYTIYYWSYSTHFKSISMSQMVISYNYILSKSATINPAQLQIYLDKTTMSWSIVLYLSKLRMLGRWFTFQDEIRRMAQSKFFLLISICPIYSRYIALVHTPRGEAMHISFIDFQWTRTETKNFQWVNNSPYYYDNLHQLRKYIFHITTKMY